MVEFELEFELEVAIGIDRASPMVEPLEPRRTSSLAGYQFNQSAISGVHFRCGSDLQPRNWLAGLRVSPFRKWFALWTRDRALAMLGRAGRSTGQPLDVGAVRAAFPFMANWQLDIGHWQLAAERASERSHYAQARCCWARPRHPVCCPSARVASAASCGERPACACLALRAARSVGRSVGRARWLAHRLTRLAAGLSRRLASELEAWAERQGELKAQSSEHRAQSPQLQASEAWPSRQGESATQASETRGQVHKLSQRKRERERSSSCITLVM